ncbi:MAG: glucokinase [Actinomycetota bacterium]|jgi:glucokinase|nr:glucokinase [Actinomycetota bacterium]
MARVVVGLDVGGTNSRIRACAPDAEPGSDHVVYSTQTVHSTKQTFLPWLARVVGELAAEHEIAAAVAALAGPTDAAGGVRMTNWLGAPTLSVADLESTGLPSGVLIVNDTTVGMWGLIDSLRIDTEALVLLRGEPREDVGPGNCVYLAPGTGLGSAAAILSVGEPTIVISSEVQHLAAPALGASGEKLLNHLRRQLHHSEPSWEDVVSGRGLVNTYQAFGGLNTTTNDEAGSIAAAAIVGEDRPARAALDTYYRYAGRFAQLLTLAFDATGGVFIGGTSTQRNLSYLDSRDCHFLQEFLDNRIHAALLERIPVYALLGDLNIEGACRIATDRMLSSNR